MKNVSESLSHLTQEFNNALSVAKSLEDLEQIRLKFLSRQGLIAELVATLKDCSSEEKRTLGPLLNTFKQEATLAFNQAHEKLLMLKRQEEEQKKAHFDVTAYTMQPRGSLHPYTHCIQKIEEIATSMGFQIVDGPEVETDYYNFETLNIPKDHPARDFHDTLWLDVPSMLLRTHTSTVQVHAMQSQKPPMAVMAPGRCYRHEATDASHDFMFMQCEGLLIDKNISMAHLFSVTRNFLAAFFEKKNLDIRIRPCFFPFVEPGVEIDMSCPFCQNGCSTCKHSKWIEICGAGLIHPNVLRASNIDPEIYSGFAFGFGLTRLVMLQFGINDIRYLHDGKIEFLKQF